MTTTGSDRPLAAEDVLDRLRTRDASGQILGGFGPLVLAAVLVVVMMVLAPSVAPERVVERPMDLERSEIEP